MQEIAEKHFLESALRNASFMFFSWNTDMQRPPRPPRPQNRAETTV